MQSLQQKNISTAENERDDFDDFFDGVVSGKRTKEADHMDHGGIFSDKKPSLKIQPKKNAALEFFRRSDDKAERPNDSPEETEEFTIDKTEPYLNDVEKTAEPSSDAKKVEPKNDEFIEIELKNNLKNSIDEYNKIVGKIVKLRESMPKAGESDGIPRKLVIGILESAELRDPRKSNAVKTRFLDAQLEQFKGKEFEKEAEELEESLNAIPEAREQVGLTLKKLLDNINDSYGVERIRLYLIDNINDQFDERDIQNWTWQCTVRKKEIWDNSRNTQKEIADEKADAGGKFTPEVNSNKRISKRPLEDFKPAIIRPKNTPDEFSEKKPVAYLLKDVMPPQEEKPLPLTSLGKKLLKPDVVKKVEDKSSKPHFVDFVEIDPTGEVLYEDTTHYKESSSGGDLNRQPNLSTLEQKEDPMVAIQRKLAEMKERRAGIPSGLPNLPVEDLADVSSAKIEVGTEDADKITPPEINLAPAKIIEHSQIDEEPVKPESPKEQPKIDKEMVEPIKDIENKAVTTLEQPKSETGESQPIDQKISAPKQKKTFFSFFKSLIGNGNGIEANQVHQIEKQLIQARELPNNKEK